MTHITYHHILVVEADILVPDPQPGLALALGVQQGYAILGADANLADVCYLPLVLPAAPRHLRGCGMMIYNEIPMQSVTSLHLLIVLSPHYATLVSARTHR